MATSRSIHHTSQSPITCDICDTSQNVDAYCLECKGNLCTTCKVGHAQARMFRNHKIVPITEGLKLQAAEEECNVHPPHICSLHCRTCQKPVCIKCITGDHKGHEVDEIETVLQKVQREIKKYYDTLENKYLPEYKEEVAKLQQSMAECKKVSMSVKSKINDKRTEAITEVHKVCDAMINQAEDEEKRQSLYMETTLENYHDKIKEIEQLMTTSLEALTNICSEQMNFNQNKPSFTHLDLKKTTAHDLPLFMPGKIDKKQIAQLIGNLVLPKVPQNPLSAPDINISIIHRNKLDKGILSVNAVDASHAWVSETYPEKCMSLVTIGGKEIKCIDTEIVTTDCVLKASGDIVTTHYDGRCVRMMTESGQVTNTINMYPNHPSGVCVGNNGQNIVLCVTAPDRSSCKLVVYNSDDKEVGTIKYTDKPVGRNHIQRVTQNNRGDYCVAHRGHNKVYVVDSNGARRYTYDGSGAGKIEKEFLPWDICSDIYNHLFISDLYNHKIHMLDDQGQFLRFILTEQDGISNPTGLCIDQDGRLWVGQYNGGLCIVKYLK